MTGPSLLQAAVQELYAQPIGQFTARRKALAAAARKAGDRAAAGQIAALRKPTLSADMLNRLVRSAPEQVQDLLHLGAELRAAEQALNARELRDLSVRRRGVVSELTTLAFDLIDGPAPSAAIREEVTGTLNAALADEQVAELLMSGTLVTQARWDGFGSASLPEVAAALLVDRVAPKPDTLQPGNSPGSPDSPDDPETEVVPAVATERKADADRQSVERKAAVERRSVERRAAVERRSAERRAAAERQAAAELKAAGERADTEHRRLLEAAEHDASDARAAATAANQTLADIDRRISELSLQLAHQRKLLAKARQDVRLAENGRRAADLALDRVRGTTPAR